MGTESVSPRYRGLDRWSDLEILDAMVEGQLAAVASVRAVLPALAAAAADVAARLAQGGRLAYAGAGTSGRIAVQDLVELIPTFGWPDAGLIPLMAGGETALARAAEGAEDDMIAATDAVRQQGLGSGDAVIGVAASGRTPYTVALLRAARANGALTVAVANVPEAPLFESADHPILLDTGAEVIAGSTRMKAGTAQKAALNLLSSLVMVRLGRVHDGLMVDMRPTNDKLRARAAAMVAGLAGVTEPQAALALVTTGQRIKPAVLVARGLTPEAADRLLAAHGDRLRPALEALDAPAKGHTGGVGAGGGR